MSIMIRKRPATLIPTPNGVYVQLFIDEDGLPKIKDSNGDVLQLSQSAVLTLIEQGLSPSSESDRFKLYTKDVTGNSELFLLDSDGNEIQATNNGNLSVALSGISGLGAGVSAFLATPSSANLAIAVTNETGSGDLVFAISPTLITPALGTPSSGVLTNCTGRVNAPQTADKIATSGTAVTISSTAPTTGQVLTATSSTAADWETPSGGTSVANFWEAPATPHANDVEFNSTTLPVGWAAYYFNNTNVGAAASVVTATPISRSATGLAAGQIRVQANRTEKRSWLLLQACSTQPTSDSYGYFRSITAGANHVFRGRLRMNRPFSGASANEHNFSFTVCCNNGGFPDISTRQEISFIQGAGLVINGVGRDPNLGGGVTSALTDIKLLGTDCEFVIAKVGNIYTPFVNTNGLQIELSPMNFAGSAGNLNTGATLWVGFRMIPTPLEMAFVGNTDAIFEADYYRQEDNTNALF